MTTESTYDFDDELPYMDPLPEEANPWDAFDETITNLRTLIEDIDARLQVLEALSRGDSE